MIHLGKTNPKESSTGVLKLGDIYKDIDEVVKIVGSKFDTNLIQGDNKGSAI